MLGVGESADEVGVKDLAERGKRGESDVGGGWVGWLCGAPVSAHLQQRDERLAAGDDHRAGPHSENERDGDLLESDRSTERNDRRQNR